MFGRILGSWVKRIHFESEQDNIIDKFKKKIEKHKEEKRQTLHNELVNFLDSNKPKVFLNENIHKQLATLYCTNDIKKYLIQSMERDNAFTIVSGCEGNISFFSVVIYVCYL